MKVESAGDTHAALCVFNGAKSAEKGVAELVRVGTLLTPSVDQVSGFFIRNDGRLDLSKVAPPPHFLSHSNSH